jgi:hypothetical protein
MQGLKPVSFLVAVTARLKPCPVTKPIRLARAKLALRTTSVPEILYPLSNAR